jgi:hypothetical protein
MWTAFMAGESVGLTRFYDVPGSGLRKSSSWTGFKDEKSLAACGARNGLLASGFDWSRAAK